MIQAVSECRLKKPSKATNWAWKYFYKFDVSFGHKLYPKAVCDLCLKRRLQGITPDDNGLYDQKKYDAIVDKSCITMGESQSPWKLEHHIQYIHPDAYNKPVKEIPKEKANQSLIPFASITNDSSFAQSYIEWVCDSLRPLSTCETESFQIMINAGRSKQVNISRKRIREMIIDEAATIKEELIKLLKGNCVAITTYSKGIITDEYAEENYVAITAHFIDAEWDLHSVTLKCSRRYGINTALEIKQEILDTLNEFALRVPSVDNDPHAQVSCVVSDTSATMIAVGRLLTNDHFIPWQGCVDRILELTTGLKFNDTNDIPNCDHVTACAQRIVSHFASSAGINMNEDQREVIARVAEVVEPLIEVQKLLEGEYYSNLSLVPFLITKIRTIMNRIINDPQELAPVRTLVTFMKTNFESHWTKTGQEGSGEGFPLLTIIAAALDPRSKSLRFIPEADRTRIWNKVQQMLQDLLLHQEQQQGVAPPPVAAQLKENEQKQQIDNIFNGIDEDDDLVLEYATQQNSLIATTEINNYRMAQTLAMKNGDNTWNNPLKWWKDNARRFPNLSILARKILCIPATSTPSERESSTIANNIATLEDDVAVAQIFLHDTLPFVRKYESRKRQRVDHNDVVVINV